LVSRTVGRKDSEGGGGVIENKRILRGSRTKRETRGQRGQAKKYLKDSKSPTGTQRRKVAKFCFYNQSEPSSAIINSRWVLEGGGKGEGRASFLTRRQNRETTEEVRKCQGLSKKKGVKGGRCQPMNIVRQSLPGDIEKKGKND